MVSLPATYQLLVHEIRRWFPKVSAVYSLAVVFRPTNTNGGLLQNRSGVPWVDSRRHQGLSPIHELCQLDHLVPREEGRLLEHQSKSATNGEDTDSPVRDHKGNPIHGNLHIWYTGIKAAQEAKVHVAALDYEYDPCSDSPERLLLYLDEGDEVPVFRHHEPFVNLLELHQKTMLSGISEGTFDPVYAYWHCRAPVQAVPNNMTSLAGRLQWHLQANAGPLSMSTTITLRLHGGIILWLR